jgi:hypothetical protein
VKRSTEIFPQVMEWMWRDWPAAPAVGETQNDFLQALYTDEDKGWEKVGNGTDGKPVTRIIYADLTTIAIVPTTPGNTVWQYLLQDGQPTCGEPFYWLHNDDSRALNIQSITFDGNGNLWAVTNLGIQVCDQNGRVRAILRLPQGIDTVNEIKITEGYVWLHTPTADWRRRLNVIAPILGQRPESQGQG